MTCGHCGNTMLVESWKAKHGKGKYCSVACRHLARRRRVDVVCQGCGQKFETWASHATRRVFCSFDCKWPNRDRERFEASIERTDGCWNWTARVEANGYGRFTPHATHRAVSAHRMAYELAKGPIPFGLQIDHLCRNRRCVNPAHLEAVTPAENVRRALKGKTYAEIRVRRTA